MYFSLPIHLPIQFHHVFKIYYKFQQKLKEKDHQALQRGRVQVSYGRVMFLGPAAVGKTSLRHGLMNQPLPDKPDSTILAQTRPVKYSWVKIVGHDSDHLCMAEVSEEDELDEEAQLILDAKGNSDMSRDCMAGPHHSLEVQSHEEVEKHTQQVLAKAEQMQSQHAQHQEMWLHLWDCGGQPVFLDVLPAFLSSRTLYLLIFDASRSLDSPSRVSIFSKGKQKDDAVMEITTLSLLQKWIASIHARFGDTEQQGMVPNYPRIILVGTHGDQLAPGRPVEEKKRLAAEILNRLNASFKGKGYADIVLGTGLVVDNTTAGKGALADSGFRELHSAISTFVQEKLSTETPVSWVHFRKVLELRTKKKKPVIELAEVFSIAAECHVPEGEVHSALLFYHELGVFLFYPSIEELKSVVILEPQWLVDRFGELFASWKRKAEYGDMWNTLTQFGILVEPLFEAVWSNVREHNLTPGDLVKMLEHFLLAAPIATTQVHAKSDKVKEYFVPHMLQFYHPQSSTSHSAKSKSGKVKGFFSLTRYTSIRTHQDAQSFEFQKAAPIHITFLSGYVPPGYYVQLVTSLASMNGVMVLFHTGIYRNHISMDIGVDRLTITEHNETVELQFSRQESIEEPFRESCRRLLMLLNECFSKVHQWLPGANTQLAFFCSVCSKSPQPDVPTKCKLCPFTLEQYANQHLHCCFGHKALPSSSQKYWLKYEMNAIQQEQVLFEEKIHLAKSAHPEAVLYLAKQIDVDPLRAVIHQYRHVGGNDEELIHILSDMKLTTWPDVSQSISHASQLSTPALVSLTANQTLVSNKARTDRFSLSHTITAHSSKLSAPSDAATEQLKPLNRPEYFDLLHKVAARATDKWKCIGIQLDIPMDQLNAMTATDPISCYADVFNWWQRNGSPPYTWATIIDALRAPIVGEVQLAHELEEWLGTVKASVAAMPTFTKSNATSVSSTSGVRGSTRDTLTGAVQSAALTIQPTTSSDSQAHIKEYQEEVKQLQQEFEQRQKMGHARDVIISNLEQETNQMQKKLKEYQEEVKQLQRELEQRQKTGHARDLVISNLEQETNQMQKKLKEYQEEVEQLQQELEQRQKTGRARDVIISNLEQETNQMQKKLKESQEEVEQLQRELEQRQKMGRARDVIISNLEQEKVIKLPSKSTAVQANYLAVAPDFLRGVEVSGETVLEVVGDKPQKLKWPGYGFYIEVPEGALSPGVTASVGVKIILNGQFKLPENSQLISAVYWISSSVVFLKEVAVNIQHCAVIRSEEQCSKYKFIIARCSQEVLPYRFREKEGLFNALTQYATIKLKQFSLVGATGQEDTEISYMGLKFYKPTPHTKRVDFIFVVIRNLEAELKSVTNVYSDWKEDKQTQMIMFENDEITLDLPCEPPKLIVVNDWKILPLTYPKIRKVDVERFQAGTCARPSTCNIELQWTGEGEQQELSHRVKIIGAEEPNNYFQMRYYPHAMDTPVISHDTAQLPIQTTSQGAQAPLKIATPLFALDAKPGIDILTCLKYTDEQGETQRIHIMDEIGAKWKRVGRCLKFSICDLDNIESTCHGDAEECSARLLNLWLQGHVEAVSNLPITWQTLLEALKDARMCQLADKLTHSSNYTC